MTTVTLTHDELRDLVRDAYLDGWDEGGEDSANSCKPMPGGTGAYGPSDPETHWRCDNHTRKRTEDFIRRGCPDPATPAAPVRTEEVDRFTQVTREMAGGPDRWTT